MGPKSIAAVRSPLLRSERSALLHVIGRPSGSGSRRGSGKSRWRCCRSFLKTANCLGKSHARDAPSMDFALQQNSELTTTNWADVTNTATLNLTSLQTKYSSPSRRIAASTGSNTEAEQGNATASPRLLRFQSEKRPTRV